MLWSFVSTFLRPLPAWIDASKALRSGIAPPPGGPAAGGGGGPGGPGGGGGGGGAPVGAAPGGGGGGGGGADGASKVPFVSGAAGGGGGGGGGAGDAGLSWTGVADFEGDLSSMALRGRGGPMVPNNILASCFALPPPGWSSSSEESLSDSATDQSSSSSGRARDLRSIGPGTVYVDFDASCCARRWNGLVDCTSTGGELTAI